ncbi:MAG: ERF family protein [Haloechinothrix sp.]
MSDAPGSLTAALAAVQANLPSIAKGQTADAGQYTYTYADLASVSKAILPKLGAHGLAWITYPTVVDGRFVLVYELRHVSGEAITGVYPLSGNTPQQIGSAITYARRYCLCSVTGVAPESDDDDAKAASHRPQEPANPDNSFIREVTDAQVETFGEFRLQIQGSNRQGLDALVPEIKQACEEGRITGGQNNRLADLWSRKAAELDAKQAARSAEETITDE